MQGNLLFIFLNIFILFFKTLFGKKSFLKKHKTTKINLKVCLSNTPLSKKKFYKKRLKTKQGLTELDPIRLT